MTPEAERKIDLRQGRRQHPGRVRTGCRCGGRSVCGWGEGDLVAEGLELADEIAGLRAGLRWRGV